MCTRFLYIDGENISKADIMSSVTDFIQSLGATDVFVGKLYGNRDVVKSSVPFCLSKGLTFVETSTISSSKKNITDMKITVDCIFDVVYTKETDFTVTLLSKDCDFLPLFYKLNEMGIRTEMPFCALAKSSFEYLAAHMKEEIKYDKTTSGLDAFLKHNNFYSPKNADCLGNLFNKIKKKTGGAFPDSVIEAHIKIKTKKFNKLIAATCGEYNIGRFRSLSAKDFSFESIIGSLGISDKYEINKMYVTYLSKVFGYIPKKKELPEMLLESLSNAVKEGRVPSHSGTALKIML